jgi:hypothetical protein
MSAPAKDAFRVLTDKVAELSAAVEAHDRKFAALFRTIDQACVEAGIRPRLELVERQLEAHNNALGAAFEHAGMPSPLPRDQPRHGMHSIPGGKS